MDHPIPHPVLLNTWKHHAGWVRHRLARAVTAGPEGVAALPAELVVIGTRLMDLYTGVHTPAEVAGHALDQLRAAGRLDYPALAHWLAGQGGYAVLDLPDTSRWAVRLGPVDGRYVHLHPGRWSPYTVRVQANTLKSAVMVVAHARLTGGDPLDPAVVNAARRQYLGMLPVREVAADAGLGSVVWLLAG